MSWLELHLELPDTQVERAETALLTLGALSITLRDNANEPILEPPPGTEPVWSQARVIGLFEAGVDRDTTLAQLRQHLPQSDFPAQWRQLEDRVWEREWLAHFKAIRVNDDFWVHTKPVDAPGSTTLLLDPGLAFGTGTHPTTALCLERLAHQKLEGQTVVDLGCGSGILAIAAVLRGADQVYCVDIDPQALMATANNMARNQILPERYQLSRNLQPVPAPVDWLVANILAGPLMEMATDLAALVRPGGRICLSGILIHQAENLKAAYAPYFQELEIEAREEWTRITGRRPVDAC